MNIKNYKSKRDRGLVKIIKAGGGYAYSAKKFNKHDGSEISADVESISIDTLSGLMENLIADAKNIMEVVEDIEILDIATASEANVLRIKDLYKWFGF